MDELLAGLASLHEMSSRRGKPLAFRLAVMVAGLAMFLAIDVIEQNAT